MYSHLITEVCARHIHKIAMQNVDLKIFLCKAKYSIFVFEETVEKNVRDFFSAFAFINTL